MSKELVANANLSHYRILQKLGAGGMGEIYLAQDTKLDRKVALKILPPEFAEDAERMSRFVREAKSASALNHPNIITIHEIGESDGTHFIATEFIDGKTLNNYTKANPLNYKSALEIAIQVASALDEAHLAGIVHRDIKPDNVMIRSNGLAKILDFGIAKLSTPKTINEEDATAIKGGTTPGMIIGTANYMSPEQAKGKEVDARTDIFSFGVVLYEMIAGQLPFEGENALEMIGSILNKEPKPLNAEVPSEISKIIRKCIRKDRDERYQTIKDVLIDLKDVKRDLEFQDKLERSIVPNYDSNKTQILHHQTTTNQTVASNSKIKYFAAGLLTLLLAVGGFFGYKSLFPTKQIESIAVMPFVNESGNADVEYLSDGMTETLISSLTNLPNLSVKARSSVFRYKGKETDTKTIGKELNVQAILTGRVIQRGDQLTLSLELVDVATENAIWSQQYNRKQSDLVALQSEIARDVSSKLKSKLSNADVASVEKNYTANAEAYQLYLKGRFFWNKRTSADIRQAIEFFNQAIETDPSYALAYSGLADCYNLQGLREINPKEGFPKAKAMALKALEIDDTLAEAHNSLGFVKHRFEWDFKGAEKEFKRAVELKPNYATVRQWYAFYFASVGKFTEAVEEMKRAQEIDPLSLEINADLGYMFFFTSQHEEAMAQLQKTVALDAGFAYAHYILARVYLQKGMFPEAVAKAKEVERIAPENSFNLGFLCYVTALSGQRTEAQHLFAQIQEMSKQRYVNPVYLAWIYVGFGDKDKALETLNKSFEERSPNMALLKADPIWDGLRDDPRFKELVKKVGIPE